MSFRNNLQIYIDNPHHSLVVYRDEHCVVIKDKFPKSVCHFLVLPVDETITHLHPLIALEDHKLRQNLLKGIEAAKDLAVNYFVQKGYIADDENARNDFKKTFIKVGIHSIPSMANLHIHVLTKDMCLPCMKNKKHYNSFNTDFFVEFLEFQCIKNDELDDDDSSFDDAVDSSSLELDSEVHNKIRKTASTSNHWMTQKQCETTVSAGILEAKILVTNQKGKCPPSSKPHRFKREMDLSNMLKTPLHCVHCNHIFGNRITQLKEHLRGEFVGHFKTLTLPFE